jgi:hypothetical protein
VRVVDVMKKTEKPEKDMRGLATKINLAKTKCKICWS